MDNDKLIRKCAEKLIKIAPAVTSQDRKDAMKHFDKNYWTIHRYLKGEVKNLDFGVKLFNFLEKKIESRKEALA